MKGWNMANKPKTNATAGGKNYFRVRAHIGYDDKGKHVYKNFYGTSKSDAESKKKQYLKDLESGINPDLANQSLSHAMNIWLWDIEKHNGLKSSSFERYEGIFRNYVKAADIGLMPVSDIKKLTIKKYYNSLKSNGKSYSQLKNLHKLLNKFFGYAETDGYILKNPCKGLKIPVDSEEDLQDDDDSIIETFTREEIKKIIDSLDYSDKIRYIIMFALFTGMRQGEILALEKSDIKEGIVKINKTLRNIKIFDEKDRSKSHYELKATKPKTNSSNREVPIPDILKPELKRLEKLVAEERLKLGPLYTENNLLFPSLVGSYMDAQNLMKSWKKVVATSGVEYKKFHTLRHTYATRLFENGASILTVSRLLGHSSIKTTEVYTHVLENIKKEEVQCLNNMLK